MHAFAPAMVRVLTYTKQLLSPYDVVGSHLKHGQSTLYCLQKKLASNISGKGCC